MGRHNAETIARLAAEGGGPPLPFPKSLDDIGPILTRWPMMLRYMPDSGELWWAYVVDTNEMRTLVPAQYVATKRKVLHNKARNFVTVDGYHVEAAKVVWLLHHGEWPPRRLIRRDGDFTNDRIENLELSDEPETQGRVRKRYPGVARFYDRWQAYVRFPDGGQKRLGVFKTEEEAIAARKRWDDAHDLV